MRRLPDWPARLSAYLDARRDMPFAWGTNDCCMFAAGALQALTGVHPCPQWVGAYSTATGAARLSIHTAGADDPFGVLHWPAHFHLAEIIRPALAGRGDVVAVRNTGHRWPALAVVAGAGAALVPGADGLVHAAMSAWERAWKV